MAARRSSRRGREPHYVLLGSLWLGLYVFAVILPLLALLVGPVPPGREFLRELSVGLGFAAASIMCVQFALTARFKRVQAPYGIDLVYHFHREITYVASVLVVLHLVLLITLDLGYARLFNVASAPLRARFGVGAVVALLAIAVTSAFRRALRLPYEAWRRLHGILATVVVGAAIAHIELVGHYVNTPVKRVIWILYPVFWVGLLVWAQVVKPLLIRRRPYTVTKVQQAGEETWTVTLRPEGHGGLRFHPGQFAWFSLDRRPFWHREHPFSFSSGIADLPAVSFTIRERGDFTAGIGRLAPGTTVYLDGSYGHFSYVRHPAPGYVFIAGGIGITPVICMLRSLAAEADLRPLKLIYVCRSSERCVFGEELPVLAERLSLDVTFVAGTAPPDWTGETGRLTPQMLDRLLPEASLGYHYFVCGPDEMMDMVERELYGHGVHFGRVHSERFNLV